MNIGMSLDVRGSIGARDNSYNLQILIPPGSVGGYVHVIV